MAFPDSLESALKTLTTALELLDAAVERRAEAAAAQADLEQELAIMEDDRTRLAEALEQSRGEGERLRIAQAAVADRLARMGAACAAVLARPDA